MTICTADVRGAAANCCYPREMSVTNEAELKAAVARDYVCAAYRDGRRSAEGFLRADCLPMDCDNDHSDREEDWITPEDVARIFPGVGMAVHYSRNHMKQKGGRTPRPRFHILFSIDPCTDAGKYRAMKIAVHGLCPFFDGNALDAARFFFGTEDPEVAWIPGERTLDRALRQQEDAFAKLPFPGERIPQGQRNKTLSVFAARVLKRFGNTEEAQKLFLERAAACDPPLPEGELRTIWLSACRFYAKISRLGTYVAPEEYRETGSLRPKELTELAEARILAGEYADRLRYSAATQYLVYRDGVWKESNEGAVGIACEFLERQLDEHAPALKKAAELLNGAESAVREAACAKGQADQETNRARTEQAKDRMETVRRDWKAEEAYQRFLMGCCTYSRVNAILNLAKPMLTIDVADLDADPYLLNTPGGEVDLRTGELTPHDPRHYHTRMTKVTPSEENMAEWLGHIREITCGDEELARYFQLTSGEELLGTVRNECLRIEVGTGANGKSTYTNTKLRVMGTYGGQISAEALTMQNNYSKNWEIGELRGKRLVVAGELNEWQRLNDALVKKICSTDPIVGEKKHKDPFTFLPSHSVVLYTNHLPRVNSRDQGIWRRLKVIPFRAALDGSGKFKNYTEYLTEHCGGAVLKWMIDGAKAFIANGFEIEDPPCVKEAIAAYRYESDWFLPFIRECCESGPDHETPSGELYACYREFAMQRGERVRSAVEFSRAVLQAGYERKRTAKCFMIKGLRPL